MAEKVKMTEEQAREIYDACILGNSITTEMCFINGMKAAGYILPDPVEESEEMWKNLVENTWDSCGFSATAIVSKQHEAIQYLKAKLEARSA